MDKKTEELLLKSTSIIKTTDLKGRRRTATCFFIKRFCHGKEQHYLLTNKHVLQNKSKAELHLDVHNKNDSTHSFDERVKLTLGNDIIYSDEYDIAALNIDFLKTYANNNNKKYDYNAIEIRMIPNNFDIFSNIQTIIMLGYPDGIYNASHNLPIVRKGITATTIKKNLEGKEEFIIDIPSIGGSSGSPIFAEVDSNLYLIGILRGCLNRRIPIDIYKNRLYHAKKINIKMDVQLGIAVRANQISKMLGSTLELID